MDATQAAIAALVCDSVGTSTQDQYRSLLRSMIAHQHPTEKRPLYPGWKDFLVYLTLPQSTTRSHCYIDHLRAAVMWNQRSAGLPVSPADAQYVGYAVEGWKRRHANVVSPRGAITADMFEAMLGMLIKEKHNHGSVVSGMIFQWGFGLRVGQVRTLTRAQFFYTPQSGQQPATWTYIGPRHKDRSSVSAAVAPEMHRMAPEVLGRVDAFLAAAPHEPGPLFAGHNGREVNAIIKRAAARLGWPKNVKWNGSHCLRHGALVEANRHGGLELVRARGAHRSTAMQAYYAQEVSQRVAAAAKRNERSQKSAATFAQRSAARAPIPGPVHQRIVRAEQRKKARKVVTVQRGPKRGQQRGRRLRQL